MSKFNNFMLQWGEDKFLHFMAGAAGFAYLKWKSMRAKGQGFKDLMGSKAPKRKGRGKLRIVRDEEPAKADPKNPKYWQ